MKKKLNNEIFLERALQFCYNYDYSKVNYINSSTKVEIICNVDDHGSFFITPTNFFSGYHCRKCALLESFKNRASNTEEFIQKAIKIRPEYKYDRVQYQKALIKVEIGCSNESHGYFWVTPANLLQGHGCPKCAKNKKSNTEEFIEKAKKIFPDYRYDKVKYEKALIKVEIGCSNHTHEYFYITPNDLLNGVGCKKCFIERYAAKFTCTTEQFIEKAIKIHPEYKYDKVDYVKSDVKVKIGCFNDDHGYFFVEANSLLQGGGCPKCAKNKKSNTEEFVEKAKAIFPQYNYNEVDYVNSTTKVKIECGKHGWFFIKPNQILNKQGCKKCGRERATEKTSSNTEEFISKAIKLCPDYIYDKVDYKNCSTKVKIGCATHGYFNISPNNFLHGYGCPKCSAGFFESFVRCVFEILFKTKFNKIRPDWLRRDSSNWRSNLELDGYAYIDFLNIALAFEYQGEQHEMIVDKFKMKQEDLIKNQKYDQIKRDKCKDCGVYLIEIPYFNKNFKLQDLKEFIKNKCIELGITLISDFDSIVIDVAEIANKIIGRNYSPHLAGISTEQISTSFSKHPGLS